MTKTIIHLESFLDLHKYNESDHYFYSIVDGREYTILKYLGGYDVFGRGFPFEAVENIKS